MSEPLPALFDVPELAVEEPQRIGRAEAALHAALAAALEDGRLDKPDAALAAAALVCARGLDAAERGSVGKHGLRTGPQPYAIAALLTPYREALHALRLPTAIAPAGVPLPAAPAPAAGGWADELKRAFAEAE